MHNWCLSHWILEWSLPLADQSPAARCARMQLDSPAVTLIVLAYLNCAIWFILAMLHSALKDVKIRVSDVLVGEARFLQSFAEMLREYVWDPIWQS